MRHTAARLLLASALALVGVVGLSTSPASATVSPPGPDLGWMRLQPTQGTIDDAVDGLAQAKCPGGEAIVVQLTGPGIPTTREVGYLVGNTALTALPPTPTGQLWVPMSLTFRDWFGRNVPGVTPAGTYTLTTICRDAIKSAVTYGHYSAQVSITKAGGFTALGAAAQPFNTTKGEKDPLANVTASPGATASPSAGSGSSAPATAAPSGSGTQTPAPGATPGTSTGSGSVAASSPTSQSGGGVRVILLGLGALLLIVAGAIALRARRSAVVDTTPGRHGADAH
jgi:hypothetical protein